MNKYLKIVPIIFLLLLVGYIGILIKENKNLKQETEILINNQYSYSQDLLSLQDTINNIRGVYKITIRELSESKDNALQEVNKLRNMLNVKDKELKELVHINASIQKDTTMNITTLENDSCEFDLKIEYNPQTIFKIKRYQIDSNAFLEHSANISSSFNAIIYKHSYWKEPVFFKRLFKFKWGKYHTERSVLKPSNDLIKIKDFKVIKIKE